MHVQSLPILRGRRAPGFAQERQRGVALVIALLLLVVITLVGFSAVRGTIVQQKLASNMYDRQVAFQNAEAAMRAAADLISSNPALIARNCQAGGVICLTNPFDDPNLPSGSIHTVQTGTTAGKYTAASMASGQPQYVIENMGNWADASTNTGFNQTANAHNYGAQGVSATSVFYRVTARSGDPSLSATKNRAIVTLQAVIKKG
ncbi:pilus assembly protein [Oleiagrimonas citrea]|uniref:Pilus assembly protein n=1 Tax=Oleiagrimonas citrea TaxID=1665687 RepID=A0A846ZJM2_9GAMM|nr:PilX N-terminal domain-containing pilus assembly protein [Oleiagrimonas citrea]NKZ37769.1 pilus assembly protein [Oleiagrimonas citrea]